MFSFCDKKLNPVFPDAISDRMVHEDMSRRSNTLHDFEDEFAHMQNSHNPQNRASTLHFVVA